MRILLIVVLSGALIGAPLGAATYVSEECAFRFEIPAGWRVVQWDEPCGVRLRPIDWVQRMKKYDVDHHTIWLSAGPHPSDLFSRDEDGKWVIEGRGGNQPAEEFELRGMRGLRGTAYAGVHHEGGGFAGLVDLLSVRLCGQRCVVVQGSEEIVEPIVNSFAFTGPARWSAEESYRRADALLNEVYQQAMSKLPPAKRAKLRQEQRDWIRRRDIQCIPEATECLERFTRERVGELDPIHR